MKFPVSTPEAARLLGVAYWKLHSLLRFNYIQPAPRRNADGRIEWTASDLSRAKRVLDQRPRRKARRAG